MNDQINLPIMENDEKIISYLTFKLGEEVFAANISKVLNIVELPKITKVPMAPSYIKGVINLRGDVLPVVDVRMKFGMGETKFLTSTCILLLIIQIDDQTIHLGALVNSLQEVLEIEDKEILPAHSISPNYNPDLIIGLVEYKEDFIMLLDVERVLTTNEIKELKKIQKQVEIEEIFEMAGKKNFNSSKG